LDQGKRRDPNRLRAASEPIQLGNEPPLLADGATAGLIDRRRVSVQWFSGTILTALCGAALMGGAVYVALDGEANFAALPERVEAALRGTLGNERSGQTARKTDKLPAQGEINAARQTIRISTTTRVGDREMVRVRPYVRVASNLTLTTSELSANVPKFNPAQLLMDNGRGNAVAADETPGAEPDAEVSFVTRDLASVLPRAKFAAAVPREDVIAQVRDAAQWTGGPTNRPMTASLSMDATGSARMAYATEGDTPDPYAGFEARIVPENITLLPKSAGKSNSPDAWNERTIMVKRGESAQTILRELGASADDIRALTTVLGARGRDGGLREGQKLRILLAPDSGRLRAVRVIVASDSAVEAVVALSDTGKYVAVDVQSLSSAPTEVADADEDDENDSSAVRLYQSIYETAMRNQIPRPVIDDLVRIYSYDVDFQRRATPGDSFEVLYSGEEDADARNNDVLYAALTVGGETKKFFRYVSPDDGLVDYYDESGKSAKKFLVRKPVGAGIMRSGFGFRRHPILGYSKMHTGVDWAAPYGTPIFSSGNGVVDRVGWEGGYGKYVRVKHNNGYETAYGHMSAYARGIEPGKRIRQGQVIGFVGSTGLSTGAHVHYEIVVNGRFVDPMRIRLPRGRVLEGPVLAQFDKERERIETIMSRKATAGTAAAGAKLAQTN
jgi:murein DD-endopeptidase MepM/ murein hydrolase activator NlpD